jgi:hypothetical protein
VTEESIPHPEGYPAYEESVTARIRLRNEASNAPDSAVAHDAVLPNGNASSPNAPSHGTSSNPNWSEHITYQQGAAGSR